MSFKKLMNGIVKCAFISPLFLIFFIYESFASDVIEFAKDGNVSAIESYIENKADVNVQDDKGMTPLMWAAYRGNYDISSQLIKHGAYVDAKDNDGVSAVVWAFRGENNGIVKLLLTKQRHTKNIDQFLVDKFLNKERDAADKLISLGARFDLTDAHVKYIFMQLVSDGKYSDVEFWLKHGASRNLEVDEFDSGMTPLMMAAEKGHFDTIKLLIFHGADVNRKVSVTHELPLYVESTALFFALIAGHIDVAEILVNNGADLNALSQSQYTPLIAIISVTMVDGKELYAKNESPLKLVKFLLEKSADVNIKTIFGETALMAANKKGYIQIVKLLKANGAIE